MSGLVLDASAALALLLDAGDRPSVRGELRDRIVAGDPILVPPVFWLQLVDVLSRRADPPPAVVEAVYELEQIGIETAEVGRPGVLAVIDAVGRGLDAWDAAYLVLAEAADAEILTTSPSLAAVAANRAILVGRAPAAARPRPDRSWARWKGAVAYLRELRAAL